MLDIQAPVGANGTNRDDDVLIVQELLNTIPVNEGGAVPTLDLDGWCLAKTVGAIQTFQRRRFNGWSDGRVDPGGKTIKALNDLADGPGTRTLSLPDKDPSDLAVDSIPQAISWANDAVRALNDLAKGSSDAILLRALQGHFKITPKDRRFATVRQNFDQAIALLGRGKSVYRTVTRRQMEVDLGWSEAPGYTLRNPFRAICWTPIFHSRVVRRSGMDWSGPGFGPKCRAAMVLHEPIHAVDTAADFDVYEHGKEYATIIADRAIHNAASYPSFAAHVSEHSNEPLGPLYGAGHPEL
jgi:hypothetical protein